MDKTSERHVAALDEITHYMEACSRLSRDLAAAREEITRLKAERDEAIRAGHDEGFWGCAAARMLARAEEAEAQVAALREALAAAQTFLDATVRRLPSAAEPPVAVDETAS